MIDQLDPHMLDKFLHNMKLLLCEISFKKMQKYDTSSWTACCIQAVGLLNDVTILLNHCILYWEIQQSMAQTSSIICHLHSILT